MEEIIHIGNLYTETVYKIESGDRIKLSITLDTEYTVSNRLTLYVFYVYAKLKGYKKWRPILNKVRRQDVQNLNVLTDQQIYNAMYNHWQAINPVRHFANGSINGEFKSFTVEEKPQVVIHKCM